MRVAHPFCVPKLVKPSERNATRRQNASLRNYQKDEYVYTCAIRSVCFLHTSSAFWTFQRVTRSLCIAYRWCWRLKRRNCTPDKIVFQYPMNEYKNLELERKASSSAYSSFRLCMTSGLILPRETNAYDNDAAILCDITIRCIVIFTSFCQDSGCETRWRYQWQRNDFRYECTCH